MTVKEEIRNWVLDKIQNGEWHHGNRISSINQITTEFNVSRETVRLSLENLVQRGILFPRQGKGYYIAGRKEINFRVALLCKIDGIYIHPLNRGLIEELGDRVSMQVNEIRQPDEVLKALLEDFVSRQAIEQILVIPIRGREEETDKILSPIKRRIRIGWIDRAPAVTRDPVFLCDYKTVINLAVDHFKHSGIHRLYYFSRNQDDGSVFTKMRNAFKEAASHTHRGTNVISDWQQILSIVNNSHDQVGIMAEVDTEAVFLLSRLKSNHIRIPQQVSIISCDNSEITDLVTPAITSVDPGFIELGRKAGQWIKGDDSIKIHNRPYVFYSKPILIRKESSI